MLSYFFKAPKNTADESTAREKVDKHVQEFDRQPTSLEGNESALHKGNKNLLRKGCGSNQGGFEKCT